MATIEVTNSAVRLLLAERMADAPQARQDKLLAVLEKCLSRPQDSSGVMTAPVILSHAELNDWMPIAAGQFVEGIREQLREMNAEKPAEVVQLRRSA